MKAPNRRKVPVFKKDGSKMRLIDYVSLNATSIRAAKVAKTETAKFSFVDNQPAWIAFNRVA